MNSFASINVSRSHCILQTPSYSRIKYVGKSDVAGFIARGKDIGVQVFVLSLIICTSWSRYASFQGKHFDDSSLVVEQSRNGQCTGKQWKKECLSTHTAQAAIVCVRGANRTDASVSPVSRDREKGRR